MRPARLWLLAAPVVVFIALMLVWPLVRVLIEAGSHGLYHAFETPYYWGRLRWSLEYGLGSSLLVILLSVPLAYVFRYRFFGRELLLALITVPFVLPTIVVAVGFLALVGPRGLLGLNLTGGAFILFWGAVFYNLGLSLRVLLGLMARIGEGMEEAARVLGATPLRAFLRASLPLLRGGLMAGGGLTFVYTFASFGLPLILAGPGFATLEVEIYSLLNYQLNLSGASTLILMQLIVTGLVTLVYSWAQASAGLGFNPPRPARPLSGAWRFWLPVLVWLVLGLLFSPLGALFIRSLESQSGFGIANYLALVQPTHSLFVADLFLAVGNTIRFALLALIIALPLGFLYAYAVWKGARFLDGLGMLPLLVSPVSIGVGYILAYPHLGASLVLLISAYALMAYPLMARALLPAMRSIPNDLEAAAASLGAGAWRRFVRLELPLLRPALTSGIALAAAAVVGEFGATLVLSRPEWTTMVLAIYQRLSRPGAAGYGEALALSVLLGLLSAGVFVLLDRGRGQVG